MIKGIERDDEHQARGHRVHAAVFEHNQLLQGTVHNCAQQRDCRESPASDEKEAHSHRSKASSLVTQGLVQAQVLVHNTHTHTHTHTRM